MTLRVKLNDGQSVPQLGFGVYKVPDAEAARVVELALDTGYRHIDTATLYNNEAGVGRGVRASGVPREEIFVTTKVWDDDHGYDKTLRAFDASLQNLGFDYVDLYLIHWPVPRRDLYVETWRALEALRSEGRVLSIGVSNFNIPHLERLMAESDTVPALNQVELHPWLPQTAMREFDDAHGIRTEAWAPLARGRVIDEPVLNTLAQKYGKTAAQIVIRWHLQLGTIVIPKTVTASRIRENFEVFDFSLSHHDLALIQGLESGLRTGLDPDNH